MSALSRSTPIRLQWLKRTTQIAVLAGLIAISVQPVTHATPAAEPSRPAAATTRNVVARPLPPTKARVKDARRTGSRPGLGNRPDRPVAGDSGRGHAGFAANAPVLRSSFDGTPGFDYNPASVASAAGPTRYIELVNSEYAIFDRSNHKLNAPGYLNELVGGSVFNEVTSAQVIWDPDTKRFFYAANIVDSWLGLSSIAVGYSKTASPVDGDDFCHFAVNDYRYVGETDFPMLGDTKDFLLVGVNVFTHSAFSRSDLIELAKPPSGSTCATDLPGGSWTDLTGADGKKAFTPVPANQVDSSSAGHVLARSSVPTSAVLTEYTVTRNASTGLAVLSTAAKVTVPSYTVPTDAPQQGTNRTLDTLDGRLTQVVSAVDPARGNKVGLWTQHTVLGGAGAEVRWYEIDAANHALMQSGKVTSPTVSYFNAAISPDRKVDGTTKAFGQNMVLTFNRSSAISTPAIQVVSKRGAAAQSAPVTVASSKGPYLDSFCNDPDETINCEWGDYAAASPDPAAPTSDTAGRVFGSGTYSLDGRLHPDVPANWLTRNFLFTP